MKKITFIIFLMTSLFSYSQSIDVIDFKVNEPAGQNFNSGTIFDFEFKIKGDYRYSTHGHHQIDLIIYKDAISSSNEIARSYWNREDDHNLYFSSYTLKNWWNTSLINYSTQPNKKFILVVKYAGLTKTLTYNYPDVDSDGDGVFDSQDECPNQSGPASNNGCPYDISISDFRIFQKNTYASGNPSIILDYPTANFEIKHTGSYNFAPKINLEGGVSGNLQYNIKIVAYKYTGDYYPNVPTNNSSNFTVLIDENLSIPFGNETEPISNFGNGVGPTFFTQGSGNSTTLNGELEISGGTTYALSVIIKPIGGWSDIDNSNNQINIQFLYNNVEAKKVSGKFPKTILSLDNFSRTTVNNGQEEERVLQTMQKGFYVIHSSDGKKSKMIKQ